MQILLRKPKKSSRRHLGGNQPGSYAVVDYARGELGIAVLTAIVSATNAPSIGLIEKLGLTFEQMITMPGDDHAICLYSMALTD